MGLVNRVVRADRLMEEAKFVARRMAQLPSHRRESRLRHAGPRIHAPLPDCDGALTRRPGVPQDRHKA